MTTKRFRCEYSHRVAIICDESMLKYRNHLDPNHPECPERISTIFCRHEDLELLSRCHRLQSRKATEDELLLIHSPQHLKEIKATQEIPNKMVKLLPESTALTYFTNEIYNCALISAGSILQLVDSVMGGESRSGVAIVRPPGHHAEVWKACGFCLFNNVAVVAAYSLNKFNLKIILIVDWDIHHGNGTPQMFYNDRRVLYISIHRYDNATYFPCSEDANYDKVGYGEGTGFNVNIPWNSKAIGNREYLCAFLNVIMPIAYQFNPELVLVSAGFDAAEGDPLGECEVTPQCFGHITHILCQLANGRLILALEGGYNLEANGNSMAFCTKALLGDPLPPPTVKKEMNLTAVESIRNVVETQSKYWPMLNANDKQT